MGQTLSGATPSNTPQVQVRNSTRTELGKQFAYEATNCFKRIELYTLQTNLGLDQLNGSTQLTKGQLFELIGIDPTLEIAQVLFNSLQFLSNYPNLTSATTGDGDTLTIQQLLNAIAILGVDSSEKLFGKDQSTIEDFKYELPLLLLSFAEIPPSQYDADEHFEAKVVGRRVQWTQIDQFKSFDSLDLDEITVTAKNLLSLFTFLLLIAPISLQKNSTLPLDKFADLSKWAEYEHVAFDFLRSADLTLSHENYTDKQVAVSRLVALTETTWGSVFGPLHYYLRSIFYDQKNPLPVFLPNTQGSRILSEPKLAQLATILSPEMAYQRLQKLYIASENGFSMRGLETKIFKWNAPTIILIKGRYLDLSRKEVQRTKQRMGLYETFPKFYPAVQDSHSLPPNTDISPGNHVLYMAYVNEPWRISNKDSFGDAQTLLAELECRQIQFKASGFQSNYAYFSTIGGGIGFGSKPPLVKGQTSVYRPGEVSLTLDDSLEVGNFRHLGVPGTFANGSCFDPIPEYDTFFSIGQIEVWGCGSEEELEEQRKRWEWENREAVARQGLNANNMDDNRAILEMAGIIGQNQAGGSI